MIRLASVSVVVLSLVFLACASSDDDAKASAQAAGGTPAPDGAAGYCCPASIGGCALIGGYQETGACPTQPSLCDNLCDARIVKDEHGCDKFEYTPCGALGRVHGTESDAGADASRPDGG